MSRATKDLIVKLCFYISLPIAIFSFIDARTSSARSGTMIAFLTVACMFMQTLIFIASDYVIDVGLENIRTGNGMIGVDVDLMREFWTEGQIIRLVASVSIILLLFEILSSFAFFLGFVQ